MLRARQCAVLRQGAGFMKRTFAFPLLLSFTAAALAQGPAGYYRFPAVHGNTVVFTAEGDLWRVPLTGGQAQRLTTHPGAETRASFSLDGKSLAFVAHYEGPAELYVMPADGGNPRRLTWESANPSFTGWTPDGRVMCATRLFSGLPSHRLVSFAADGSAWEPVPLAQASEGTWSADGRTLVFTRFAFQGSSTKRYQGGTAQNLWRWTRGEPEAVPLTADFRGTSRAPHWWGGRVLFLSDRDGCMNLWSMLPDGKDLKQHTQQKAYDVKSPALAGNIAVYQHGADLRRIDLTMGEDALIPVTLATDSDHQREQWVKRPMDYLTAAHLSPDGSHVVLTARGQVFVAPVKPGRFVEVTREAAVRHRHARFTPDGARVFTLSDTTGELEFQTFRADGVADAQPSFLTTGGTNFRYEGFLSPDGKWLIFDDRDRQLWLWSLEKKTGTLLAHCPTGEFEGMTWSPDSQWVAWAHPAPNTVRQIHLHNVTDGTRLTATSDRVESFSPAWSADGQWLFFLSDRDLRSAVESPWGPRQPEPFFDKPAKLYGLALTTEARWPFLPPDELHVAKEKAKKEDDKKEEETVKITIAPGLEGRLYEVPVDAGNYSELSTAGGHLFWLSSEAGINSDQSLMRLELTNDELEPETLGEELKHYELSADGEKLLLQKEEAVYVIDAHEDKPEKLDDHKVPLDEWTFSFQPRGEWRQMFTDSWRMMRDWFYDPKMHGVNWQAVREKYEPIVGRVSDRQELSDLISEMAGELSALHIFVEDGDVRSGPVDIATASLGASLTPDADAGGWRISSIAKSDPDFPALLSPLARPEAGVRDGDLISEINGRAFGTLPHYAAALRRTADTQVMLTVKTGGEVYRKAIVTPITAKAAASLRYGEWEYTRRLEVERRSQNRIGYVHLRAMGDDDMAAWVRDYFPVFNRQGLIIDVRHNRGGNIDSWILSRLLRKAWMYWQPRTGAPEWNMQYAFRGHLCVLCDEFTASDGEAFSDGVKRLGLGKVIGTRTWGGEIWLSFENELLDQGIASAAEIGVYGPEGAWLIEGHGVDPDIVVDNLPAATFNGSDAQLDAALQHLEELITKDPRPVPPAPPHPDKSRK